MLISITPSRIEALLHFCIMRFESGQPMPVGIRQIVFNNFKREDFKANGVDAGEFISWLIAG